MTDKTQELDGIMDKIYDLAYDHLPERGIAIGTDRIKQAIIDWNNKQIEAELEVLREEVKHEDLRTISQIITARVDELKHLVYDDGIWHEDMTRQFPQKITINQRIKELEAWTN